jgi:hypothetical protein
LKHNVCLREKSGTATACSLGPAATPTVPQTGIQIPNTNARFFHQVWSVTNNDKAAFDNVEWAQEWSIVGDCNSTTTMPNCQMYNKTFGTPAAAGAQNNFYVTRNSGSEGFNIVVDDKVMGNAKALTLAASAHTGSMTNTVSLWTGAKATKTTTGWSTIAVSSVAKSADSMGKHPSIAT